MKTLKNKIAAIAIAIFFILSMTASITLVPNVSSHSPPWTIKTYAFATATPNPVGVGQTTTIVVWVDEAPPTGTGGDLWNGYKVNITKPDGTTQIIGPFTCQSYTASTYVVYTPDQVGTYTIVFSWPGQTLTAGTINSTNAYVGDYFEGATSEPLNLTVQQAPITLWQEPPLPTQFWTVPINDANRGWSQLASNWLQGSWLVDYYQTAGQAPESAHVLWAEPMEQGRAGGINDAEWAGIPSNVDDYENPWSAPIIMNGKIFHNQPQVSDSAKYGYYCVDLYTGQQIWYKNGTDNGLDNPYTIGSGYNLGQSYLTLTQGQLYHYSSINGQGILSYLIMVSGSTWYFLDPATGNFLLKLINVPSGTAVTDQDGSLLRYSYSATTGNLLCWNSSQAVPPLGPNSWLQGQWRMRLGATIDAVNDTTWTSVGPTAGTPASDIGPRSGYTMNVTIQKGLLPITQVFTDDNRVPKEIFSENFVNGISGLSSSTGTGANTYISDTFSAWLATINEHVNPYSPYPDKTPTQNNNLGFGVTVLWNKTITVPLPGMNYTWKFADANYDSQVFTLHCKQTRQLWGYSLATGDLLWGPTPEEDVMDYYDVGMTQLGEMTNTYDGITLESGLSGTLYAFNATTGVPLWTYNATSIGAESPYGKNYPLFFGGVCDDKVYLYSNEHSPTKPLWRGSYLRCVNLTDGTEIWKLLDYNYGMGIADGYIVTASDYDNNMYCIGKGPSAMTVDAPDSAIAMGQSLVIRGTVTDISPGTKQLVQTANFPSGVPAIADDSMEAWMEYLYEQQAMPTNATGVPVQISVIDSNGNTRIIGTPTSDASGTYSFQWTPDITGKYTVVATFAGSKSYYGSSAETAFAVDSAAPTASPYPVVNLPPTETYIFAAATALAVVMVIIGALIMLMLRKRP